MPQIYWSDANQNAGKPLFTTEIILISHILREQNSIMCIIYLYIYRLRENDCIVTITQQATKPFVCSRFWHKQHKLV